MRARVEGEPAGPAGHFSVLAHLHGESRGAGSPSRHLAFSSPARMVEESGAASLPGRAPVSCSVSAWAGVASGSRACGVAERSSTLLVVIGLACCSNWNTRRPPLAIRGGAPANVGSCEKIRAADECGLKTKRSEERTSELQSLRHLVCRLL